MSESLGDLGLSELLRDWIEARTVRNPRQSEAAFRRFFDWAAFMGLPKPADGEDVASYLLGLMADGVSPSMIKRAARAIRTGYVERRCYLDPRPIDAALAIVDAQTSPNRTLN
jgi:hypothetical protein